MAEVTKKIVNIPSTLKDLFSAYLTILKPLNKLRDKEIDLMAYLLYQNELEKDTILKEDDRWNKILGTDGRVKIMQDLNISQYNLNNYLSSLRKKNAIVNNRVSKYYIPKIENDTKNFQIIFNFNING